MIQRRQLRQQLDGPNPRIEPCDSAMDDCCRNHRSRRSGGDPRGESLPFAGAAFGLSVALYQQAGASIIYDVAMIFATADLLVKVKEPLAEERQLLRAGQIIFTYLHLAPDKPQTEDLLKSGASCLAYETVTDEQGGLPLLAPMSEVAGRMAIQAGAHALQISEGGLGILPSGVPGVAPANILIIGGGVVGSHAAQMALGLGAEVTIIDKSLPRLRELDQQFSGGIKTLFATADSIERSVIKADMVIGAVLLPGAQAPKLISRELLSQMKTGAVLVDVAIDQGGCFASSKPTTHAQPTYIEQGVVHYCVANMPGAVARTSTFALTNATLPFILALADKGLNQALADDIHLRNGLNIYDGKVTCQAVAEAQGLAFTHF
ncbi:MAG: alanine dehydrogenase [Methylophaga sp.]